MAIHPYSVSQRIIELLDKQPEPLTKDQIHSLYKEWFGVPVGAATLQIQMSLLAAQGEIQRAGHGYYVSKDWIPPYKRVQKKRAKRPLETNTEVLDDDDLMGNR